MPFSENRHQYISGRNITPEVLEFLQIYTCPICEDILNEPIQTKCGCRFCRQCIDYLIHSGSMNCPNCHSKIAINGIHHDRAIEKEIITFQIQCHNEGCDHICEWKNMISHENICEYRLFQCDTCQLLFPYNIRDEHLTNRCQKMLIKCNECGLEMTREDLDTKHRNIKEGQGNLCSKGLCSDSIKSNMRKCSRRSISCPLNDLGYPVKPTSYDITMPLQTHTLHHLTIIMGEIIQLRMENENLSKAFQSTNQSMTQEINSLKQINEKLIEKVNKLKSREIENGKNIENLKLEIYRNQV